MFGCQNHGGDRPGREEGATSPIAVRLWPAAAGGLLVCASASAPDAARVGFHAELFLRLALDNDVSLIVLDAPLDDSMMSRIAGIVANELDLPADKVQAGHGLSRRRRPRNGVSSADKDPVIEEVLADCVRMASATIQAMLICAAAETWRVVPGECHTAEGAVVHRPTGRRFRYGVLAADAALQRIPRRVTLRNGENRTISPC